jgi:uncharacterized protein (DUF302 family)
MKAQSEICPDAVSTNKFYSYPAHKFLGVFDKPEKVKETLLVLKENGFQESDFEVICNAGKIDFSGEEEKLWGRIKHTFDHLNVGGGYLDRYKEELKNGDLLLSIAVRDSEKKEKVTDIMKSHGGNRLTFFGNWVCEGIPEVNEVKFATHSYGIRRELETPFNETLVKTRQALQKEGFGILVDIDMKETLKEKLGIDFRKYVILGACNPPLANSALQMDLDIGLLLPCNVVVYESKNGSVVAAIDAEKMLSVADNPKLERIAKEVNKKLERAVESL